MAVRNLLKLLYHQWVTTHSYLSMIMTTNKAMCSQLPKHTARKRSRITYPSSHSNQRIMPFDAGTHASDTVEKIVGLRKSNIDVPRAGDRTAKGECAPDQLCSHAVMHGLVKAESLLLWNALPDEIKTTPGSPAMACVLSKVASVAGETVPPTVTAALNGDEVDADGVLVVLTPGSPFMFGRNDANKLISFVYLNMDKGRHRVRWSKLTGEEQYEWYKAWVAANKGYERVTATVGLRGTDLGRITDTVGLEAAMQVSPSMKDRRPDTHQINEDEWKGVARELDFWLD